MMKQSGLKIALVAALFVSTSLQSSQVLAQALPGAGGIGKAIGGILGGDRATKTEQLAQIAQSQTQLEYLFQMLEFSPIVDQMTAVFDQLGDLLGVAETVYEYDVPEKFTQDYELLTDEEYAALTKEREEYFAEIDAEIAALEADVALDENQTETLMMAAMLAEEPPSDITIGQAQFIGDAARLEQQRREATLKLLRDKRADIKEQLTIGDEKAFQAVLKCIRTCT